MDFVQGQVIDRAINLLNAAKPQAPREEEVKGSGGFLDLSRRDLEKYSILRAISLKNASIMANAGRFGGSEWQGIEAECDRALSRILGEHTHQGRIYIPADWLYQVPDAQSRDLNAANFAGGGALVNTSNMSFIELLRNLTVLDRLGAQRVPAPRANVTIPKQTGGPTITWHDTESTQSAESTPTYSQIASTPKTCSAYHEISHLLLTQGGPAAEGIVRGGMAEGVAVATDFAGLAGSGANGEPTGVLNTSGITSVSGASAGYATVVGVQKSVADSNAVLNAGALGYCTTPTVAELWKGKQRFSGSDSPLWQGALNRGVVEGIPALATKQMPAATALYGDWSSLLLLEWGVLEIEVNPFTNFKAGIVGVRVMWSLDVVVRHPSSFAAITAIS